MKKRLLTALLSGALILTALAGCGQGAENQSGANDASAGGESGARDELKMCIRDRAPTYSSVDNLLKNKVLSI